MLMPPPTSGYGRILDCVNCLESSIRCRPHTGDLEEGLANWGFMFFVEMIEIIGIVEMSFQVFQ